MNKKFYGIALLLILMASLSVVFAPNDVRGIYLIFNSNGDITGVGYNITGPGGDADAHVNVNTRNLDANLTIRNLYTGDIVLQENNIKVNWRQNWSGPTGKYPTPNCVLSSGNTQDNGTFFTILVSNLSQGQYGAYMPFTYYEIVPGEPDRVVSNYIDGSTKDLNLQIMNNTTIELNPIAPVVGDIKSYKNSIAPVVGDIKDYKNSIGSIVVGDNISISGKLINIRDGKPAVNNYKNPDNRYPSKYQNINITIIDSSGNIVTSNITRTGEFNTEDAGEFNFKYGPFEIDNYTVIVSFNETADGNEEDIYYGSEYRGEFTVNKGGTNLTVTPENTAYGNTNLIASLTSKNKPLYFGPNQNITFNITNDKGISYYYNSTTNNNGIATLYFSLDSPNGNLPIGNYNGIATFAGNKNYNKSSVSISNFSVTEKKNITLNISKEAINSNNLIVGDLVNYTINVTNDGTDINTSIFINDLLNSNNLKFISSSVGIDYDNITGVWTIPKLDAGETKTLNITAKTMVAGNIKNTAFLNLNGYNNNGTNSSTANITVNPNDIRTGGKLADTGFLLIILLILSVTILLYWKKK
jgi:uncharacterized repeat protein (TIGR01451 family)